MSVSDEMKSELNGYRGDNQKGVDSVDYNNIVCCECGEGIADEEDVTVVASEAGPNVYDVDYRIDYVLHRSCGPFSKQHMLTDDDYTVGVFEARLEVKGSDCRFYDFKNYRSVHKELS